MSAATAPEQNLDDEGFVVVDGVFATEDDNLDGMNLASLSRDLDQFHENEAVQEALANNVDLTAYSKTTDSELSELQETVVEHHFKEADHVAALMVDMDKCDGMLEKMQSMLQVFQKNLSQVSAEMRRLQGNCEDLDTKLKNRRLVEKRLRKFIERIIVSPAMKETIENQPVKDPEFAKALSVLNEKISFIRLGNDDGKKSSEDNEEEQSSRSRPRAASGFQMAWLNGVRPADTVSVQQVIPDLEALRRSAVQRIQEFFVSIFTDIRQAEGEQGAQMMLQNTLQKHMVSVGLWVCPHCVLPSFCMGGLQVLLSFLRAHAPAMVRVLQESYTKTIERLFGNTFKSYLQGLLRAGQQVRLTVNRLRSVPWLSSFARDRLMARMTLSLLTRTPGRACSRPKSTCPVKIILSCLDRESKCWMTSMASCQCQWKRQQRRA